MTAAVGAPNALSILGLLRPHWKAMTQRPAAGGFYAELYNIQFGEPPGRSGASGIDNLRNERLGGQQQRRDR